LLPQQIPWVTAKTNAGLIIPIHIPINVENLVKIGTAFSGIFGGICHFLSYHPKSYRFWTDLINFAHNVAEILPFNILKSELWHSNLFRNISVPNKGLLANFALKLLAMATSLEESEKKVQINHLRAHIYHLVKKSW